MDLGLDEKQATQLIDNAELKEIFDAVYKKTDDAKRASSLVLTQLLGFLNAAEKQIAEGPDAASILELLAKIDDNTISANAGKEVLEEMVASGKKATEIIEAKGMKQITDTGAIEALVNQAIAANPKAIESYKAGKEAALGAIVGWVMKESKGQANPAQVNEILLNKIKSTH